jgi:hypothetical protein
LPNGRKALEAEWYYGEGGSAKGPFSSAAIAARIQAAPEDQHLVWSEGMSEWTEARLLGTFARDVALERPSDIADAAPYDPRLDKPEFILEAALLAVFVAIGALVGEIGGTGLLKGMLGSVAAFAIISLAGRGIDFLRLKDL